VEGLALANKVGLKFGRADIADTDICHFEFEIIFEFEMIRAC